MKEWQRDQRIGELPPGTKFRYITDEEFVVLDVSSVPRLQSADTVWACNASSGRLGFWNVDMPDRVTALLDVGRRVRDIPAGETFKRESVKLLRLAYLSAYHPGGSAAASHIGGQVLWFGDNDREDVV